MHSNCSHKNDNIVNNLKLKNLDLLRKICFHKNSKQSNHNEFLTLQYKTKEQKVKKRNRFNQIFCFLQ